MNLAAQEAFARYRPERLQTQILALFMLIVALTMATVALYTASEQTDTLLDLMQDHSAATTAELAITLEAMHNEQAQAAALKRGLSAAAADPHLLSLTLTNADGTVLHHFIRSGDTSLQAADFSASAAIPPATGKALASRTSAAPWTLTLWHPVKTDTISWIHAEFDLGTVRNTRNHIAFDTLVQGVFALLIGSIALLWLLRRPLSALKACTEFAEHIDQHMGDTLAQRSGTREIDHLANALNWASLRLYDQQSAITENEARKSAILSASLDCLITFDSFGNVLEFNPAAERLLGWTRNEALQRPVLDLLVASAEHDEDDNDLLAWLRRHHGDAVGHHIEIEVPTRNGRRIPAEIAIAALELHGRMLYTAYLRDIRERKRIAAEILHAKETAESANRAKSDFVANMSHEIRTPMNAILGMTELALETDLNDEQREYLTLARQSAHSLLNIINDILDFSKIEAGKLQLEAIGFRLRDTLGAVFKMLEITAAGRKLYLRCDVDPMVPDHLRGDPTRLKQIVTNLISNALKFTPEGGVDVRVSALQSRDGAQLHIEVKDSGVGIPADKQTAIFEAFSQADSSTTRKFGGTGLGLAICSRLAHDMGGRIWVESEPGRGSTFHVMLTFDLPTGQTSLSMTENDALDELHILLVTPDPVQAGALSKMLSSWQMKSHVCTTVSDANAVLIESERLARRFHLVLMDADEAAAVQIQSLQAGSSTHPPVILIHPPQALEIACDEATGHVRQPVHESDLLDAIMYAVGAGATNGKSRLFNPRNAANTPPLNVLLAEDNSVNQTLAVRLLSRLGHRVTLANNGREAVDWVRRQHFDVVLMDLQMPELGGLEATGQIRRIPGREHMPIIAMTAHAMKGDRERCLDAGMTGYVSKPIQVPALVRILDEVSSDIARPANDLLEPKEIGMTSSAMFDRNFLLDNLGGEVELMHEIVALFLRDYASNLNELRAARDAHDLDAMRMAAHALKGMVSNYGAHLAVAVADDISQACKHEVATDELSALVERLIDATEKLAAELRLELSDDSSVPAAA